MAVWVCPHCPNKKAEREIEKIQGLNRLYAFPCEPKFENNGIVVLDSGAFGLSQSGGKMNLKYMQRLSQHYKKYYRNNVFCVAPDEFMNPEQSMMNFMNWHKKGLFKNIVPVLQSDKKYAFEERTILAQAEFYREFTNVIFWGSPKLTGKQAKSLNIEKTLKKIKDMGYVWIHKLGAGWDIEDVKLWGKIKHLDSFDSIAYYTSNEFSKNYVENVKSIINALEEN